MWQWWGKLWFLELPIPERLKKTTQHQSVFPPTPEDFSTHTGASDWLIDGFWKLRCLSPFSGRFTIQLSILYLCGSSSTKAGPNNNRHMEKANGLINIFSKGASTFMNAKRCAKCGSYHAFFFLASLESQGSGNIENTKKKSPIGTGKVFEEYCGKYILQWALVKHWKCHTLVLSFSGL